MSGISWHRLLLDIYNRVGRRQRRRRRDSEVYIYCVYQLPIRLLPVGVLPIVIVELQYGIMNGTHDPVEDMDDD
jgi:hypothetical protein